MNIRTEFIDVGPPVANWDNPPHTEVIGKDVSVHTEDGAWELGLRYIYRSVRIEDEDGTQVDRVYRYFVPLPRGFEIVVNDADIQPFTGRAGE